MLRRSFVTRFLSLWLLVTLLAITGSIMVRFVMQHGPEGAQAVVGA